MTIVKNRSALKGVILASLTIIIWGSTFVFSKLLLEYYSPIQIITARFVIAYFVLLLLRPRHLRLSVKENLMYFLMAVTGVTLYYLLENFALSYTLASNVSILITFSTVMTAVIAHFAGLERLSRGTVHGFLIAFAGVVLVVFNGTFVLKLNPKGDILSILAALCWAVYSVLNDRYGGDHDQLLATRRIVFFSIITLIPIFLMEGKGFDTAPLRSFPMLGSLLLLAVFGSALCYVMWNTAFRCLGPVRTNSFIYVQPFVTIITAFLILGEPVSLLAVAGSVLIIIGVVVSARRGK